jgi:hypothetical protein
MNLIEIRCFHSFQACETLRDEVNALNRNSSCPDPFSTFEFLETYSAHDKMADRHPEPHMWFITAFMASRLVGYLVLKLVKRRVFGIETATLSFFVTHDTDRPHLVARAECVDDVAAAMYGYLLGRKREWSMLELYQQDDRSPLVPPSSHPPLAGYLVRQWPSMENCTIPVRWDSLSDYFQAIPSKFRVNVRRQLRNLFAFGRLELLGSSDPAVTPRLLELYRAIERYSWKSRADIHIGCHPQRIQYFESLLAAHQPMRVSIQVLLLEGAPIAGLVCGEFLQGLYALHIVYDGRLHRFAPGSAILLMGMRRAIEGRFAFFNMLSGYSYYKGRWLAQSTQTRVVQIYRMGGLLFWRRLLGDALRWLRRSSASGSFARYNPLRRRLRRVAAGIGHPEPTDLNAEADGQEMYEALIAQIRRGPCEFLSTAELASAMPL